MSSVSTSCTLKAGCLVYRVVEVDPPSEGLHTWKAACVVVKYASTKQILLKTPFSGFFSTRFKPNALGHHFFETPLQAIQHFLITRRLEIEALDRQRTEADRAIAWAEGQEGMKP
jgi:hypothetical protein